MRIVKLSVTNYRSIVKAHNIPIAQTTVLVGKNNEGKSNLLKALSCAMFTIASYPFDLQRSKNVLRPKRRYNNKDLYFWETDIPINLQHDDSAKTWFRLEFELNEDEIKDFRKEVGSNLNGTLPLEITLSKDGPSQIKVVKGGRGSKTLNSKSGKISEYVAKRLSFNYIPAIRTHNDSISIIDELVSSELSILDENVEYKKALEKIASIQKPILDKLASQIKEPLSEFLPEIKRISIVSREDTNYRYRTNFEVIIDDGTPTSIEYKGDGVKSLAALGLLKNKSFKTSASIIAIEEPEAHLHPGAIHQLQEIIQTLSNDSQVVLTTHNPLFVNRRSIRSNIIVDKGKANPARKIKELRDILGVRVSDNLSSAQYVLVVEGEEDEIALKYLLPKLSAKIAKALKNNSLIIHPIGGAGGLSYTLSLLQSQLCNYYVLLDNDLSGNNARDKAFSQNILSTLNLTETICLGMTESEFEDCLDPKNYNELVKSEFGVDLLASPKFKGNLKWSNRVEAVFRSNGKSWSDKIKSNVKNTVAESVAKSPDTSLDAHKRGAIDGLVTGLENFIKEN